MLCDASLIIILAHKKTFKRANEKKNKKESEKERKKLRRYLYFEIEKNSITLKFCIEFLF